MLADSEVRQQERLARTQRLLYIKAFIRLRIPYGSGPALDMLIRQQVQSLYWASVGLKDRMSRFHVQMVLLLPDDRKPISLGRFLRCLVGRIY